MSITIITPSRKKALPVIDNKPSISHLDPNIKLIAGTMKSLNDDWYEEPLEKGIRVVLVQSGHLQCQIPGQAKQVLEGPSVCIIANNGEFTSKQIYEMDVPMRYTIIQLGVESLTQKLGLLPETCLTNINGDPKMFSYKAPKSLQILANQIATCPMQGASRDFYLAGKALEFAAFSSQLLLEKELGNNKEVSLKNTEVEQIYAAHDLLISNLQDTPSLEVLAAKVGLNTRKLTTGFRKVFGMSVFEYLQEHKLTEAHRLLTTREINVSTVAYQVGYSPAHFSVAFRKKFGISPSDIN